MSSKLARSLHLSIRGEAINVSTPLLVPSFSSKAAIDIGRTFESLQPSITDALLVSAYDVCFQRIKIPQTAFAEVLFLDSGGYEIARDFDIMDPLYFEPKPQCDREQGWSIENYRNILEEFNSITPAIVTAFDHPNLRLPISRQFTTAVEVFRDFPNLGREILIKPEEKNQLFVPIPRLIAEVERFSEFDVIGITETELGESVLDRMTNIARVRRAMDSARIEKPLHIFGSLDPVCTPLYFLAGADIFDGLSWLRFSYMDDLAVYHKNRGPLDFGASEKEYRALARSYEANLHYLRNLGQRLHRYLIDRRVDRLGRHQKFFVDCLDDLQVRLPGVIQ